MQVAELVVGVPRVQGELVKVPVPLLMKVTVPVGALVVPAEVSVIVAVQVVGEFTGSDAGEQFTVVVVVRVVIARAALPELVA